MRHLIFLVVKKEHPDDNTVNIEITGILSFVQRYANNYNPTTSLILARDTCKNGECGYSTP